MTTTSLIRATTRAALFGTTALVASASGAQAIDYIVNATETSTFILGLGTADTLIINGAGEINSVSPGVAVIDLADSITITDTTAVGAEIDADAVGIQIEGATTDLTGGITIDAGAIVTATTTGAGTAGTGILVQTGADVSGGIDNSGAITGYEAGILVEDSASISGGLVNSGSIYGSAAAIAIGDSPTASSTMGAITNNATGIIGVNSAGDSVANFGIAVGGTGSDITGLINNAGSIVGQGVAILSTAGGDISGGITNTNLIGQAATSGGSTTALVGISVTSSGDISGTITNSGTIIGADDAISVASGAISGGIVNSGNITGGTSVGDDAINVSAGTLGSTANVGITNQAGGVISGNEAIDIDSGSTVYGITNSGQIFGTAGAGAAIDASGSQFNGDIINNATGRIGMNGTAGTANVTGIHFSNTDSTGGITNSGAISGNGGNGIYLEADSDLAGAITNNLGGSIGLYNATGTVSAATGILIDGGSSVAGGIINSGSIVGTATGVSLSGAASSVGTAATTSAMAISGILNNAGGVIAGGTTGIDISQATVLGGISNSGDIVGNAIGINLANSATVASITNALTTGVIAADVTAISVAGGSTITGVLSNAGVIGVDADATGPTPGTGTAAKGLLVTGSGSDITGGVNNSGTIKGVTTAIDVAANGSISGGITNSGEIFAGGVPGAVAINVITGGDINGIGNTVTGIIGRNAGSSISAATAILVDGTGTASDISGTITNAGIIEGTVVAISAINGGDISGGISNSAGGLIQGATDDAISIGAGSTIGSPSGVGISNAAVTASKGILGALNGIDIAGSVAGGITNTGAIAGASGQAIFVTGTGSVTGGISNGVGGKMTGSLTGISLAGTATVDTISNSGTIIGTANSGINISVGTVVGPTSGVGISNASSANITGNTHGINVAGSVVGGIANSGSIVSAVGDAILVTGAGGSVTGGISNVSTGSIISASSANANGIAILAGASVAGGISNNGQISGDGTGAGIFVSASSMTGNLTNTAGTISGDIAVSLVNSTLTGDIVNSANIDGTGRAGINLSSATITGAITNNAGGVVEGLLYGITIDTGSSVAGGISNAVSGTIRATATSGTGILVTGTSTVGSITNSGTIVGGTSTGYGIFVTSSSSVTGVTNAGTISGPDGSVQFGNSDSTLTLQTTNSNLIGGADGGTGTNDTVVLVGEGSENEAFTNFEHLTVSASTSGTWVLSGNSSFDDLTLNSGTLDIQGTIGSTIAPVATVTVAGGILNVSSSGVLNATTVAATGDLDVEGTIDATTVTVDGTLSGSGTISGALTVNGILSPGNSPGQLNVVGAFVEGNNSSYLVEHLPGATPETDIVVVTGTATIGTNVDIDLVVAAGTDGFEDDILTATGGITGTYDDVNLLDDNLVALVAYPDANTATLLVAKTDALAATAATVSDAGFVFLDNLQEGARRDGRVWATGYIYNAENEGLGQDGADYDQDAFGFNAGVDVISQPNLKVGVAVGYIDGEIDIDSATSDADNDGIFGAAYLNYMNDNFYLDGALMVGQQTVDTTRTLTAGDATASIDATSYGANLEAGFELEALGGRLSPFVKVGIHSASLDAYSESGAAGAMSVGEVETQQMRVGGGFRYAVDLGSADGIQVTPAIKVGMTQEWQEGDSSADIGFVGYTGSTSASLDFEDQTTVDLGLSFDVKLSQAVTAFVGWDAALGDETTRNTGTIGLSVNW